MNSPAAPIGDPQDVGPWLAHAALLAELAAPRRRYAREGSIAASSAGRLSMKELTENTARPGPGGP